ncbi:glutathione S-transferase N-terminal domain-containing protein [Pseudoalteromonas sp. S558]|uniref:glutathione S-transferase N-terminal domain-containing protein n=1 Tax=Pseudoalteromonas sp. S558 TaxID=2066515 RepID=UPI001BB14B53|nr:glutathione S-transferase N-terminal domain-containing protein [Pseudoalteromonas sp. S558]
MVCLSIKKIKKRVNLQARYIKKEAVVKVFGRTTSFNVQKILWLLDELALNYEHIELGGHFGGLDSDEFFRLNPMKKVPVLIDGDKSIWESHTILRYLVAEYGDKIGILLAHMNALYTKDG